jgi:cell division protein FtsZ
MGALTIAVVTRPFAFEGKRRAMQAERGLQELLESVDTLIVIPNDKLLTTAKDAGFFESFRIADDILRQGVQGISDIITIPGVINRDFADVKTTMAGMGYSVMGTAVRSGPDRSKEAAKAAIASPLLEAGAIDGARGILINITGSSSLKLSEVIEASSIIQEAAHEDANIIFGAVLDETLGDEVKFTVIATGFREAMPERRERMMAASALPTAHHEIVPPRVVSRPLVPVSAPVEKQKPAEETQPLIFGTQVQKPAIRFASETEVQEALGAAAVAEPKAQAGLAPTVAAPPVAAAAATPAVAEAAVEAPVQRPTYPVSSYYETARRQAWHELPRVEYTPHPAEYVEPSVPAPAEAVEEPKAAVSSEVATAPVPVVVEHIPQVVEHAPAEAESAVETVPAKASVFDDEFFRKPKEEVVEGKSAQDAASNAWPDPRVPSFAGYAGEPPAENDELDIPAFLRRKQ